MAITYTESWEKAFGESTSDREITTTAHVVGDASTVVTPFNYYTATEATSGALLPILGQQRAENPRYRLHRRSAPVNEGPRYVTVQLVWRTGKFGGSESTDDPLNAPTQYRFRPVTNGEPTDVAFGATGVRDVPIVNSAGDPFTSPVQGSYNSYIFEAVRNEANFDPAFAISFQDKLNQGNFTFGGKSIQPGEALCTGIFPAGGYTLEDEYVAVTYQFEVRERLTLKDGSKVSAFVHRLLDKGRQGYIHGAGGPFRKVAIHHRNGETPNPQPISYDVLLNEGVPVNEPADNAKDWWSVDPEFDPANGKGWEPNTQVSVPDLLAIDKNADNPDRPVTWLIYRKHQETDFSGLNL